MKSTTTKKLAACILKLSLLTSIAPSQAALIINEIDYDQPGTDVAEFIELFNTGASQVSLDGHYIDLVNGGTNSVYRTIDLNGFSIAANSYFVICGDNTLVSNCNYSFTTSTGWIQNGAPDAIGLYNQSTLIDSLSYEGALPPFNEGTTLTTGDSTTIIMSIGRIPDGIDTNDNHLDFESNCITPGSSNISGTGDCSSSINPVPVPPAVLLFGSGLIGLAGLTRRKTVLEA